MQGPKLGDRKLNWDSYGDDYEQVVYDNGHYAIYNFNSKGLFGRRTQWHKTRDGAIGEMQQLKLVTNQ